MARVATFNFRQLQECDLSAPEIPVEPTRLPQSLTCRHALGKQGGGGAIGSTHDFKRVVRKGLRVIVTDGHSQAAVRLRKRLVAAKPFAIPVLFVCLSL